MHGLLLPPSGSARRRRRRGAGSSLGPAFGLHGVAPRRRESRAGAVRRALHALARLVVVVAAVAVVAAAAAPDAQKPAAPIAPRVSVTGVPVGGLTSEPARARLREAFARPLTFTLGDRRWRAGAAELGAVAAVDDAVAEALRARPGGRVVLRVEVRRRAIRRYVARLDRRFAREPENARFAGLVGLAPSFTEPRPGRRVRRVALAAAIERALLTGDRAALALPLRPVPPTVTAASFGPVVVVRRESRRLYLYDGPRLRHTLRVATGQAQYPTPVGRFEVVDMQRHPWWRPPPSDWAKGLKPVPPGPGNPLGTRWIGLSAPSVGIHGTPDAASIGYSASHGCIRLRIPDAEWLFERVRIGTPVVVARA